MSKIVNMIKTWSIDLDKKYGSDGYYKKDLIICFIVMISMFIYSAFMTFNSMKILFAFILFTYLMVITFSGLLIIISWCLYCNPKNNVINKKKKLILKILVIFCTLFFYITSFPVLIIVFVVAKITALLGIQIFTRNIHIILLDFFINVIAYLLCICNYKIYELNIVEYFCTISIFYFVTYILRKIIYNLNNLNKFISFREKYEYLYKSRSVLMCIINMLTIFSSVAGLYISKYNNGEFSAVIIYYIMPIIIFSGLEQIILYIKQDESEQIKFVQKLYEELIIVYDIAYKQIIDFSCMKIRINITITPYMIDNYKKYLFSKNKRKDKIIIEILNKCEYMLKKEYAVYLEKEKLNFDKDLSENINDLARCLIIMK